MLRVEELSDTKRRIIERLKRVESATATGLAAEFGLTDTALRQHLDALEEVGMVTRSIAEPTGRGRPPVHWQLAPAAAGAFPDRHGELSVDLITSMRQTLGDKALDRVIAARADRQAAGYALALGDTKDVAVRVPTSVPTRATSPRSLPTVMHTSSSSITVRSAMLQRRAAHCAAPSSRHFNVRSDPT